MTTAPSRELAAPGQKLQPASPPPGTAGAAVSPQQPRLAVVTLPGEIDASNDGQVQDTLTRALDDGTAVLVADAGATAFCGCAGVTALLLAHHRAAAAGAQLRVVVGSPSMRRILELTAADQVLNTYPTLAAALADGQTPDRS
jgi:anti-sigma B factor antagonist